MIEKMTILNSVYDCISLHIMGIVGLYNFIKYKVPRARNPVQWKEMDKQHWGIDCSCLMFRAKGARLSPLTVLAGLIVKMRTNGVEPVVIFDGPTPMSKMTTIENRRNVRNTAKKEMSDIREQLDGTQVSFSITDRFELEHRHDALQKHSPQVTTSDRDEIKKLLYGCGVQFCTASGEADDVLGYLCKTGYIQAVVSTDMDMLARGVPHLIVPETADATVLTDIVLETILQELKYTYLEFVKACVYMGSDYNTGLTHTPLITVCESVDTIENQVAQFTGDGVTWELIVNDTQRAKWIAFPQPSEPETITKYSLLYHWPIGWNRILTRA